MLFHQPFINQVATAFPDTDILLGKPMPVGAAANFYGALGPGDFNPERQLRWLLDTPERLVEYRELATGIQRGSGSVVPELERVNALVERGQLGPTRSVPARHARGRDTAPARRPRP